MAKRTESGQNAVRSKARQQIAGAPKGYEARPAFVDYKDPDLKRFITSQGKVMSRKRTGLSAAAQRALSVAIKRARIMGLLAYVSE